MCSFHLKLVRFNSWDHGKIGVQYCLLLQVSICWIHHVMYFLGMLQHFLFKDLHLNHWWEVVYELTQWFFFLHQLDKQLCNLSHSQFASEISKRWIECSFHLKLVRFNSWVHRKIRVQYCLPLHLSIYWIHLVMLVCIQTYRVRLQGQSLRYFIS